MQSTVQLSLLLIRVTFGLFLLVWGLDKLLNADHVAAVFSKFYGIGELAASAGMVLGIAQVLLSLAIIAGLYKTVTCGAAVLIHGGSTIATAGHIFMPLAEGSNLLFMAGLPIMGAVLALFISRKHDTLFSLDSVRSLNVS